MTNESARFIAHLIFDEMSGRKGFKQVIDSVGENIKKEMIATWAYIIVKGYEQQHTCSGCQEVVYGAHACPGLRGLCAPAYGPPPALEPGGTCGWSEQYALVLMNVGPNKIEVIKVLRERMALGLREAVDIINKVPVVLKGGLDEYEIALAADDIQRPLEKAGATVEKKLDNAALYV